ncbi:MAG TPA: 4-amino-4-deoxy-L-arabinose transferase [Marmoricola sp.]|nr:4-amino-4-deoxy-L-arabinose transferase [Marmoricola sp.]HNI69832.1 4-amino-4-deoxy-L-arabinose transferase [Marmoricola sp.]HNJ78055.1 4-amino-4-deoxy-L-arabinose transferase [Marmoricola sp.]HNN47800.1 4-amino-4-deoxy-L-arabinose transferase [Marmoricola sp.]HNO39080.1 4-amino-4-deoxy-L-arabinose transferase [Marmoricola sp.]
MATPGSTTDPASIMATILARPATCGSSRLIAIDGPAGAGKTELTRALVSLPALPDVSILALEDVYAGWDALARIEDSVEPLLRALASGQPAQFAEYDWANCRSGEIRRVCPAPVIILEGVGAGCLRWADLVTTLVWVTHANALSRAITRDGEDHRGHLETWHRDEVSLFEREKPWLRADVVVDSA